MNALRDKAVRLFVGILTVCAFCASGIVRAQTAPSSTVTYTYTFSTCIDGDDFLVIQGNSIQWQYGDHTAVGDPRADCSMTATSIDTSAAGVGVLSTAWQPVWTPDPPSSGVLSSKFVGLLQQPKLFKGGVKMCKFSRKRIACLLRAFCIVLKP